MSRRARPTSQAWPIYEQQQEYLKLAYVLGNLGELYIEQGRSPESEPLFRQARKIFEQQLEPGHHGMAFPLNGLAHFYFEQGNYTEAESLYQQALQILEQAVGREHPDTQKTKQSLLQARAQTASQLEHTHVDQEERAP